MTQYLQLRSGTAGAAFFGTADLDTLLWDNTRKSWYVGPGGGGGAVGSVFGRVGAVVAATGDYDGDQVDNVSTVPGASLSDALDYLLANAGAVANVFGRTGAIVATAGDYDSDQIDNVSTVSGASVSDALETLLVVTNDLLGPGIITYTASQVAQLADAGRYVRMDVATGNTYTVPLNATVAFPIGTLLTVEQAGAGVTQIVAAGGVIFNKPASFAASLNLAERFATVVIKKVAADTWTLAGGFVLL